MSSQQQQQHIENSPAHQSSPTAAVNSNSPTSEGVSLSEDVLFPQTTTNIPSQIQFVYAQSQINQQHFTDEHSYSMQYDSERDSRRKISGAINTDYESSATEDHDSLFPIKYKNADHALLSYARTNKLEKLRTLLETKLKKELSLDLNYKGQQKQNFSWSALHLACYFGHTQIVQLLLSNSEFRKEIDINIQNNSGDTPLHKATLTNREQIVQLLLANGANVFIKNCDGLMAKQMTNDNHIQDMLSAAEQVDKNKTKQEMFKAVDTGDLKLLQGYFENYNSYLESSPQRTSEEVKKNEYSANQCLPSTESNNLEQSNSSLISQTTDDRGNTLLHLATVRGYKAICVYLLEQGFDPFRKNNLGQTCVDLASYQLRQLFTTVKPSNSRLKKLSSRRVSRFEGPLLKKVRILGWKQIYVVLENGVILLFNNRMDSMNKSRRGYKYLESAICEPDFNDAGVFNVCFSDRSRATFLVSQNHLNNYTSYKFNNAEHDKTVTSKNQVELIRQKWIDSIRDHIKYSTDFIKNGLKLNDHEDENDNYKDGDLSTLNHLLPVDTIKSFTQEARAHYSILDRHAESLCNLVQSITTTSRLSNSLDIADQNEYSTNVEANVTQTSNSTANANPVSTGSKILGFIRPSRQSRGNSISNDDTGSTSAQSLSSFNNSTRRRNNSLTNEFIQDNWHCILFHLRLLMESAENTKVSMGQALALIEHQEQLRQEKVQDQEERCRVLEDSLHALARDHHELEKSLSMSQIYHSVGVRSMSMSTDLNEYFDAFEDFDDEKTMTPDSMHSEEDMGQHIQDAMIEEHSCNSAPVATMGQQSRNQTNASQFNEEVCQRLNMDGDRHDSEYDDDDDDDDLQSNCSALTIETVSDFSLVNSVLNKRMADLDDANIAGLNNPLTESTSTVKQLLLDKHRTRLPSPMIPRDQVSIWSILKNCIGKELSKITMPVVFNEPLTMLQRACEGIQYTRYLKLADESDDPVERMELICAFVVAGLSANCNRIIKPFNPLLYETYEYNHELEDGSIVRAMAQQVSHHPPITTAYSESDNFIYNGSVNPKIKFWGRSIEVQPDGQCRIYLKRHNENYIFKSVSCSIHNIIVGKLWFEHSGPLDIKCVESKLQANLVFKSAGWFSNDLHRFDGFIVSAGDDSKKKLRFVYGKWSDYIKSVDYESYENYLKDNQQKLFRIPDEPVHDHNGLSSKLDSLSLSNSVNNNANEAKSSNSKLNKSTVPTSKSGDKKGTNYTKSESANSLDIPNSRTLWRLESQYLEEYYNFTLFTMKLNELTPELEKTLPKTDSRLRLDVRKLEEGDLDGAAQEKQRLEDKQRAARAKDKRFKEPSSDFLWFDYTKVPFSKEKFWIYKGGYWENKCNEEKFPELF